METIDHVLYKVKDGDHLGKITPNNPESPRHIVHSQLLPHCNPLQYQYAAWSPEEGVVELWSGNFYDRDNREGCQGYINGVPDLELFTMFESGRGVFAD